MKIRDFAFFTDENIDPELVLFLRSEKFDVLDVKESGLQGSEDIELVRIAYIEGRIIVTEDSDFSEIIFTQKPDFIGVIHLRPGSFFTKYHIQTIQAILDADPDIETPFILSAENKHGHVRMRIRNALPGPA